MINDTQLTLYRLLTVWMGTKSSSELLLTRRSGHYQLGITLKRYDHKWDHYFGMVGDHWIVLEHEDGPLSVDATDPKLFDKIEQSISYVKKKFL
jgi:hypothetical protein